MAKVREPRRDNEAKAKPSKTASGKPLPPVKAVSTKPPAKSYLDSTSGYRLPKPLMERVQKTSAALGIHVTDVIEVALGKWVEENAAEVNRRMETDPDVRARVKKRLAGRETGGGQKSSAPVKGSSASGSKPTPKA
jgi:hypothetical protein